MGLRRGPASSARHSEETVVARRRRKRVRVDQSPARRRVPSSGFGIGRQRVSGMAGERAFRPAFAAAPICRASLLERAFVGRDRRGFGHLGGKRGGNLIAIVAHFSPFGAKYRNARDSPGTSHPIELRTGQGKRTSDSRSQSQRSGKLSPIHQFGVLFGFCQKLRADLRSNIGYRVT